MIGNFGGFMLFHLFTFELIVPVGFLERPGGQPKPVVAQAGCLQ